MNTPEPRLLDPIYLTEQALAVLKADRLCFLATVDGEQPRLRPVSPVRTDGFTVYVANLHSHNKTREIAVNPRVELCYLDQHHDQVRITGVAEVVTDPDTLQRLWQNNPLLGQHLETVGNAQFILYRVRPTRVRYMKEWELEYHEVPLGSPCGT